ncbi:MAG: hypothetical protein KJ666_07530 [Bacteroidetes bacterium]|nr:hypothetical protein [Bacteroidota bacterium]MBU2585665.1 hypothetical protein [Bacteroidota bacterium]
MKKLEIDPFKSKEAFRKNYELHDKAAKSGEELLTKWGFMFQEFGKDKRYERVWEKGEDKPDLILIYGNKNIALLDWKAKRSSQLIINKRAYDAYKVWMEKFNLPVLIAFCFFNKEENIEKFEFVNLSYAKISQKSEKVWDKNMVVEFESKTISFTQENILKSLRVP